MDMCRLCDQPIHEEFFQSFSNVMNYMVDTALKILLEFMAILIHTV